MHDARSFDSDLMHDSRSFDLDSDLLWSLLMILCMIVLLFRVLI